MKSSVDKLNRRKIISATVSTVGPLSSAGFDFDKLIDFVNPYNLNKRQGGNVRFALLISNLLLIH